MNDYMKENKNGPSKVCERQPLKNFTWSILEYFVSYTVLNVNILEMFTLAIWLIEM